MRLYKHLSFEERVKIVLLQEQDYTINEIAEELGRNRSTIYRELVRNIRPETGKYVAMTAYYAYRRRIKTPQGRIRDPLIKQYVIEKLRSRWSPERISGRIAWDVPGKNVCAETVYMFVYKEARMFRSSFARHHMKRHHKWQRKTHNSHIKNKISVDLREEQINNRDQVGHWESDVAAGLKKQNSGLTVMVERKSRFTRIRKLNDIKAKENSDNIKKILSGVPEKARQSITYDNGSENAYHEEINKAIGCHSYFCHDGRPYEKGTVENTIGLVRRIFPKGTDFANIAPTEIKRLENWLNNLPKKCLGWKTPKEEFERLCCT
jgi:IS30 family transposase